MYVLYLIIVAIVLVVNSQELDRPYYDIENVDILFEDFLQTHGKIYSDEEEKKMRFEIFKGNIQDINDKNSRSGAIFAINRFSDLTLEELNNYMGLLPRNGLSKCVNVTEDNIYTNYAPEEMNWLDKGAVTPVKNQLKCGSCWAFSAIANIEGQYFLKNNKFLTFSEQQLVDCSKQNFGCGGGFAELGMTDLLDMGGLEMESSYPYEGANSDCKFNSSKVVVKLTGCTGYMTKDEEKIKEVLASKGPLAISLNGNPILHYEKGIMQKKDCESKYYQGHAVLLVGYGTEDGQDYWLVKNSWGVDFGEAGYFRMSRGENTCEFLSLNNHPVSAEL